MVQSQGSRSGLTLNCLLEQAIAEVLRRSHSDGQSHVLWAFKAYAYPIMSGFFGGGSYLSSPFFLLSSAAYRLGSYLVCGVCRPEKPGSTDRSDLVFVEQARRYSDMFVLSGKKDFAFVDFANVYSMLDVQGFTGYSRILKYNYITADVLRAVMSAFRSPGRVQLFWSYCMKRVNALGFRQLYSAGKQLVSELRRRGVPAPVLRSLLWAYYIRFLPEVVISARAWKGIFSGKAPGLCVITGEVAPIEYSGVVLANGSGEVPVFALQHGVIHPNHYGYFHLPESFEECGVPIPRLTMLAGRYYYKLLRSFGYPREQLAVTGIPRYDSLAFADRFYSAPEIRRKYGLPEDAVVILWTTQTHGLSNSENLANVRMIRDALHKLGDRVFVAIKLHPLEDQRAHLYRKTFSNFDNVAVFGGGADVHELMYASDAVMLRDSTTGIEAIAMGKRLVLTDPTGRGAPDFYTGYGFDWIVCEPEDFVYYVELLFNGAAADRDFLAARRRFMDNHLVNFGNATEHVVNLLSGGLQ